MVRCPTWLEKILQSFRWFSTSVFLYALIRDPKPILPKKKRVMCTTFYTLFLLYLWIRRWKGNGQGLDVGLNVRKWNGLIWKVWIAKTIEIKHHLCSCWDLCSSGWRVLFSENNAFLCIHFFCVYDVQKYFFLVFDDCWQPFEACGWIRGTGLSALAAKGNEFAATIAGILL